MLKKQNSSLHSTAIVYPIIYTANVKALKIIPIKQLPVNINSYIRAEYLLDVCFVIQGKVNYVPAQIMQNRI